MEVHHFDAILNSVAFYSKNLIHTKKKAPLIALTAPMLPDN
jgi:hypothetical protein